MSVFKFKHFDVKQADSAMKIGTDAMIFGALIDAEGKTRALDIGTGTGVLSLMVAQKNPDIYITASEIEATAAAEAAYNFQHAPFAGRLKVLPGDFLQLEAEAPFDLIFSNPPYFENSSKSLAANRNLARHDDNLPLGLLFQKTAALLAADGAFWLILPHLTMDQYYPEAALHNLHPVREILVFGKTGQPVRKITAFSKMPGELIQSTLVVRNEDGTYTAAYKQLTADFHFNVLQ